LVVVSPLEAHALAEFITARPELAATLSSAHAAWHERIAADPDLNARLTAFVESEGYVSGPEGGALELAYWQAQQPCPFLQDDRCSVYPARPFACREHHVLSNPALCAQDLDAVTPADTRLEFRAVANYVGTACYALPDRLIPLPLALEYAAEHPEERDRAVAEDVLRPAVEIGLRQARRALALLMLAQRDAG
jgi:Fe-S-cluster containining protein